MTAWMKAGVATPDGLKIADVARPVPSEEQVLVHVLAAGMNRADLAAAKGIGVASADSFGKPIGMEWAGEIVEIGSAVRHCHIGDRVACSGTGGYAEYAVADQYRVFALDAGQDFASAAILPLALMTAHDALRVAGFRAGETLLVQGASSAVGLMALQIGRILDAALVVGGARSERKRAQLPTFGANQTVDTSAPHWAKAILALTDGAGANVAIDMVSGNPFNELMKAVAVTGRVINVGRLGGTIAEFDFNLHALRRLTFHGTTFRTRTLDQVREIAAGVLKTLWPHVLSGKLALPIDRRFALTDAEAAHAYMAANEHFGKILLTC